MCRVHRLAELVADASHVRGDRRAGGFQLRPEPREVRFQPLGIGVSLVGPARAQERLAIDELAGASREGREQTELRWRERQLLPGHARRVRAGVDPQAGDVRRRGRPGGERRAPEERPHAREELPAAERLLQVVVGAEVEQLHPLVLAFLAGEHEDRRRCRRADPLADLVAAHLREPTVEDDEVGQLLRVPAERGLAVVRGEQVVSLGTEERGDHPDERAVVVDDEDARHRSSARASGTLNAKMLPGAPSRSSYQSVPPWASTTRRHAKRPMPAPEIASDPRRTNGSKIRRRSSGRTPGPSSATRTSARSFSFVTVTSMRVPGGAYFVALCTRPATTSAVRRLSPRTQSGPPARRPRSLCVRGTGPVARTAATSPARRSSRAPRTLMSGRSSFTDARI